MGIAAVAAAALAISGCGSGGSASSSTPAAHRIATSGSSEGSAVGKTTTSGTTGTTGTAAATSSPTTSATTSPPASSSGGTTSSASSSALPAPGPGFVAGQVTAVGDSVMLDYQDPLQQDVPNVTVNAAVSRQWSTGEQILEQLKSAGQLGAVVIVGLGTNGPIATSDFDSMMSILSGASRVIFVNIHVDQPWQDPNNAVLAAGVARYPNTVLVDWSSLADANPGWFGPDGTHIAIDGTAAQQLAAMIAAKV